MATLAYRALRLLTLSLYYLEQAAARDMSGHAPAHLQEVRDFLATHGKGVR